MIKQAVILCAGKGERLGEITKRVPKPLVMVNGRPFVEYSIDKLISAGVRDIILVVEYLKWSFTYLQYKYPIVVRFKDDKLDTNEAVLGIDYLKDDFLLLNGDCHPIMDWLRFLQLEYLSVCVQDNGRDAGCAIVSKGRIESKLLDCTDINSMSRLINRYQVECSLSIDTPKKLESVQSYAKMIGI